MRHFKNNRKKYNKILLFIVTLFCLVSNLAKAQSGAQLLINFTAAGSDATYWYIDVNMMAGPGYITNNTDYVGANTMGSWTGLNIRFTTSPVTATSSLASAISCTSAGSGFSNGSPTFVTVGGCYSTEPAYNVAFSRDAPAVDAGATNTKIAQLAFPKASFPAGVIVALRATTTQACASRETFWSNPGNVGLGRSQVSGNFLTLPIKLINFNGTGNSDCSTTLSWKTAAISTTGSFNVEYSQNGIDFSSVGVVLFDKNNFLGDYSYKASQTDKQGFYRLKITDDQEGKFYYSNVIRVTNSCGNATFFNIYPNPVSGAGTVNLQYKLEYSGVAYFTMYNAGGQKIYSRKVTITSGTHTEQFATANLARGIYQLKLVDAKGYLLIPAKQFSLQ